MSLNPLTPVTDYQSMLNRIFWFTSASALAAVWLLRMQLPKLNLLLQQIDLTLGLGDDSLIPIPGGYLLPALAIGLGSRVFRIHGLIAHWLGIRERFDIDVIISELANRTQVDLRDVTDDQLVRHRHKIMRQGFYQFVGGSEPQIDPLLIHRALDLWSWFWIGLEAAFLFLLAGFALLTAGLYQAGALTLLSTLALSAIGLPVLRSECRRYAIAQVRAIVADANRAEQVRQALNKALSLLPSQQQAA